MDYGEGLGVDMGEQILFCLCECNNGIVLQCWGSVKVKEHFIIYKYLKVLVTRSLKLLLAGNSVRDDHNLLLYNNCRFSLPGGQEQGQGVEVEQGFSGRKPLTHRHRQQPPFSSLLPPLL